MSIRTVLLLPIRVLAWMVGLVGGVAVLALFTVGFVWSFVLLLSPVVALIRVLIGAA
jgi:hypothetical protein